jgi:hypothetical protein
LAIRGSGGRIRVVDLAVSEFGGELSEDKWNQRAFPPCFGSLFRRKRNQRCSGFHR